MPVTPRDSKTPPGGIFPLTDFSPGIFSGGDYATTVPPSTPGAAQETDTFGCIALPYGGLAPLPKRTAITGPTLHADGVAGGTPHVPIGFMYGGNLVGYDNFLIVQSGVRVHGYWRDTANVWNHVPFEDSTGTRTNYLSLDGGTVAYPYTGCSFSYLTYNYTGGTSMPVAAVWDAPGLRMPAGVNRWPFFYDNLDGSFKGIAAAADAHHGIVISHLGDNANLCRSSNLPYICELTYYESSLNDDGVTKEPYTHHFFLDHRAWFQTYGSQSTGELILIARNGPAALIRGAYDFPQLLLLPAVMPCGTDGMEAISTPRGLLYTSEGRGAFTWNGDNRSDFVSGQLKPNFYRRTTDIRYAGQTSGAGANAPGHNVHGAKWGDYAMLPNNWLWDPGGGPKSQWGNTPGAWWKLEDPSVHSAAMWQVVGDGTALVGVKDQISTTDTNALASYTLGSLRSSYSWKSQPIAIGNAGHAVRIHDVELRAVPSRAATDQTVTVTVYNMDGSSNSQVFTLNSALTIPVRLRAPIHAEGYDVIIKITADSGDAAYPAPTVHGLWFGWTEASPLGTTAP